MNKPPASIQGAVVLCYSAIDERHRPTGICAHRVNGELIDTVYGLAICRYPGYRDVLLYYCDERWQVLTHAHQETIDDAREQAECEYEGLSATWEKFE